MKANELVVDSFTLEYGKEAFFTLSDEYPADSVTIHPWTRNLGDRNDNKVYVEISDKINSVAAIFERDKFVEGLLAVFPELTKKED